MLAFDRVSRDICDVATVKNGVMVGNINSGRILFFSSLCITSY